MITYLRNALTKLVYRKKTGLDCLMNRPALMITLISMVAVAKTESLETKVQARSENIKERS